ncbi:methyl-accepting chemotaxis protein [Vibrio tritonius]|uniref:methyl-accepting chemotaxis protein n=1 Tax=Vibrio tritonius TaxID=1435069 RepID=UPI00315C5574
MIQLHSIKTKVTLGFVTCVLCFSIASACALVALNHSSVAFKHILAESKMFSEVSEIQALFLKARLAATDYFYTHDDSFLAELSTKKENLYSIFNQLNKHEELALNPQLEKQAATIQQDMNEYFSTFDQVVRQSHQYEALVDSQFLPEFKATKNALNLLLEQARETHNTELEYNLAKLVEGILELEINALNSLSTTHSDAAIYDKLLEQHIAPLEANVTQLLTSSNERNTFTRYLKHKSLFSKSYHLLVDYKHELENHKQQLLSVGSHTSKDLVTIKQNLLVQQRQEASVMADEKILFQTIIEVATIFAFIVAALCTFFISRLIAQGMHKLSHVIRLLAQGDLTYRTPVKASQKDEFSVLLQHLNISFDSLNDVLSEVTTASGSVNHMSHNLSNVASTVDKSSQELRSEMDQVASALHQVASSSEEIANSAQDSNQFTVNASKITTKTINSVQLVLDDIADITSDIEQSTQVISQLVSQSDNIGNIIVTIRAIAEQTNMLALNAAIESARAGEQGRGFAVVADEVRTLAHRTQSSTEDIEKLIEQLQEGVQKATESINHCRDKTIQASGRAESISGTVRSMHVTIEELQDINNQVVVAVEEQSVTTTDISRNMDSANEIVVETTQNITELAKTSNHLSQLSSGLMARVRQFKLVKDDDAANQNRAA